MSHCALDFMGVYTSTKLSCPETAGERTTSPTPTAGSGRSQDCF